MEVYNIDSKLKLAIEFDKVTDSYEQKFVKSCVDFWNREGNDIYLKNQLGELGNEETNRIALNNKYDFWLILQITTDLNALRDREGIETGRGGSHAWLKEKGERTLIVIVK